ncbi:MAG: hypothetical protein HZA30_05275 [Candidatus Omnitrophica bacterium]|nr:hypothetical protein [Candidatus Omnitrophota bacterium]
MGKFSLSNAPLSLKILVTMAIMGISITYMILALHIFIDTSFKVSVIKQAYSTMDWTELVDHSHKYFPYYGIYIFAFTLFIFVLGTSYREWVKIALVVIPNFLIVIDIGSMWAIRFVNADIFSWALFLAGNLLALSFAVISALSLYDIWLRHEKEV